MCACGGLQVQHGSLQSACVLLTSGLQAKIGDVGLAQLAEPTLQQHDEPSCEGPHAPVVRLPLA